MPERTWRRRHVWSLAVGAMIGLIGGSLFCLRLAELPQQQRAASQMVEHTLEVLGSAATLEADLESITSETRGLIISDSDDLRLRLDAAILRVDDDIAHLRDLTADTPAQQQRLTRLAALNEARVNVRRGVADRPGAGETAAAASRQQTDRGQDARSRLHAVLQEITSEERRRLTDRNAAARTATEHTTVALVASGGIGGLGLICLFVLITHDRARRLAELDRLNAELEQRVARRTAELAASTARQRGYFDDSPIGKAVMRVCEDGELVYEDMNQAYAELCGFTRAASVGRTFRELWPESAVPAATRRMTAVARSGERLRYAITHKINGRERVLDIDLAPLPDPSGEAPLVLAYVRDLTEQRELEQLLIRRAEQQAEAAELEMALFRNSAEILFIVRVEERDGEADFVYEAFSPSLATTGWRAEELIGRGPDQTLPAAAAEIVLDTYRSCVAAGATISYGTVYDTPVGRREFEGSITPVLHPSTGRTFRLVGALRDVTERNKMQAALHHTQKMEAIGSLAAGVAHDFNNVLQSISGSIELMLDEGETAAMIPAARLSEFATIALRAAKRGAHLTRHLLSYARRQILRPSRVDLPLLVAAIEAMLTRTLGPHIVIVTRLDAATPLIFTDPAELETALLNLAINASHAMPLGGTLVIETRACIDAGRRWASITVTDNGAGMDEATLARASEPFFSTKGVKGTGLGLSMVQGFAEQSGGQMLITSKLGEGTRVELRLPVAPALPDTAPASPFIHAALSLPIRILLVDDDPDVLTTVGAFLRKEGFGVLRASNGTQALAYLAGKGLVDAMVTDFAMPGFSGMDLITDARLIRPDLPTVVISGYVSVAQIDAGAGAVLLRKPFDCAELTGTLRRLLAGEPAATELLNPENLSI